LAFSFSVKPTPISQQFSKSMVFISKIQINHLAVHVSSLSRSVEFYSRVMGLHQTEEPFKDGLHAWFEMGEKSTLHLIEELELSPPMEKSKTNHLCFSVSDFDSFIQNLQNQGCSFENWAREKGVINVRPDGIRQIFFQDPDGYWLEVNDDC
jgi:catechol 2,3-dioxygenase-like lactoylglutathione lyase family enzyme